MDELLTSDNNAPSLENSLRLIKNIRIILDKENVTDSFVALNFHFYIMMKSIYPEKFNKDDIWKTMKFGEEFHNDMIEAGIICKT